MKTLKRFLKSFIPWVQPECKIMILYKKSRKQFLKGHNLRSGFYSYLIYKKWHCIIPGSAEIAEDLFLPHPIGIVIGADVKIGSGCTIYQGVTIGRLRADMPGYPTIGNKVIIYANSVVAGDITVGNESVIACNSSVLKSVKNNTVVGGVYK